MKNTNSTRAEVNRNNSIHSTGPKTAEGKARASANSFKHGFFAATDHLDPQDAPAYQTTLAGLRQGMRPAGPAEDQAIQELATFRARLLRLQSIEYVLLCSEIEAPAPGTDPKRTGESVVRDQSMEPDEFELTAASLNNEAKLTRLSRGEAHLQRAYNRTWDRLLQLQKDRRKLETPQSSKRTQSRANDCLLRLVTNTAEHKAAEQTESASHQGRHPLSTMEKLNQKPELTSFQHRFAA